MIVDSSALLAILFLEPEEPVFIEAVMRAVDPKMSAASYVEVAFKVDGAQTAGTDPLLDQAIAQLGIRLVPFSVEQALVARAAFNIYGRGRHPAKLNFGDCMTYALAKTSGEPLLFKGIDFGKTDLRFVDARAEG